MNYVTINGPSGYTLIAARELVYTPALDSYVSGVSTYGGETGIVFWSKNVPISTTVSVISLWIKNS